MLLQLKFMTEPSAVNDVQPKALNWLNNLEMPALTEKMISFVPGHERNSVNATFYVNESLVKYLLSPGLSTKFLEIKQIIKAVADASSGYPTTTIFL